MIKKSSFLQELSVYWQLIDTIYLNAIRLGELIWMPVILYNKFHQGVLHICRVSHIQVKSRSTFSP